MPSTCRLAFHPFKPERVWYGTCEFHSARWLFDRHDRRIYDKDGRTPKLFVGPDQKMVLLTLACDALFVWRSFRSADGQQGINATIFRNESPLRSSDLIVEAEQFAWQRWPNECLYTYVNPRHIWSANPGYCFKKAGGVCGMTKRHRLLILEKLPREHHACMSP